MFAKVKNSIFNARYAIALTAQNVKSFLHQKSGEGTFTDVVIVILIVAIVGAVILFALKSTMPGLISGVLGKVKSGVDGVDLSDGLSG